MYNRNIYVKCILFCFEFFLAMIKIAVREDITEDLVRYQVGKISGRQEQTHNIKESCVVFN